MKKTDWVLGGLLAAFALGNLFWSLRESSRTAYGVSEGVYAAGQKEDGQISFDLTGEKGAVYGSFCYTSGGRARLEGPIDVKDGCVIAAAEPEGETYCFEIIDNDHIRYVEQKSAPKAGSAPIADGAVFQYISEREDS